MSRCVLRLTFAAVVAALSLPVLAPGTAWATGYPPGSYPGAAPAGGFPNVIVSQTLGTDGGTEIATNDSAALTVLVPAGAFTQDTQVTIYAVDGPVIANLLPPGYRLVNGFAIGWTPISVAQVPLTVTIEDTNITTSATVYLTTTSGLTPDAEASVRAGSIVISFSTDPGFVIAAPSSPSPGASSTPTPASPPPAPTGSIPPTDTVGSAPAGSSSRSLMPLLAALLSLAAGVVAAGAVLRARRFN